MKIDINEFSDMEALDRACKLAGGQNKLANHLGVTSGHINRWRKGELQIDAKYLPGMIEIGKGLIKAYELRPDLARIFLSEVGVDLDKMKNK